MIESLLENLADLNLRRFEEALLTIAAAAGVPGPAVLTSKSIVIEGVPLLLLVGSPVEPYTMLAACDIGTPAPDKESAMYLAILRANLVAPTSSVFFAALPDRNSVVLVCRISIHPDEGLDGPVLLERLASFSRICIKEIRDDFNLPGDWQ